MVCRFIWWLQPTRLGLTSMWCKESRVALPSYFPYLDDLYIYIAFKITYKNKIYIAFKIMFFPYTCG